MKSKSRLLCGCGRVRTSGGRLSLLFRRHVRSLVYSLLAEEGWRDSLIKAPGAKREPDRAKPESVVSSAKSGTRRSSMRLRPIGLTLRATPSAPLRWLRDIFLVAQGFAQKILGGHRLPLQLGVRNCRGAL